MHQTELKIPTQKKRKENRQRPRHNFLVSSKNPDSERKKEKKKKKSLSWVFLQKNTNRKKNSTTVFSSNFKKKLLLLLLLSLDRKKARRSLKNTRARSGSKTQLHEVGIRRRTRRGLKKLDDEEGVLHPSIHPSIHPYHLLLQGTCSVSLFLRNFTIWRFLFSNWRMFCILKK
jgi:hypothetical protein